MALTVSVNRTDTVGRYTKYKTGTIQFDSSYPTNGEALSPSSVGLSSKIEFISVSPAAGLVFEYDYSGDKLKAIWPTTDATAPAAGEEVANTTDLSSVTCNFIAFGF
jgi:hypothetical protein